MDEKQVKKLEEECKNAIFAKIIKLYSKQRETINLISTTARNIGQANIDIPNVGITLNNKLGELSQEFNRAGISIFISKLEAYDMPCLSFIGTAIIEDLIGYVAQASEKLDEYITTMESISKKKTEQMQALEKVNLMQKFFAKIKSVFVTVKPVDLSLTEEEQDQLAKPIQEYQDIEDRVRQYKLEDNIISSIVKSIRDRGYVAYTIPSLVEENIIPDMKKLKLEGLILQLQQALIEEYKKDLPSPEIYKITEENMYLYVPDFNRGDQTDKKIEVKDLEQMQSKTEKRNLRDDGTTLEDLFIIDKTVSANERQEGITIIGQELTKDKSNGTIMKQDNDKKGPDISL